MILKQIICNPNIFFVQVYFSNLNLILIEIKVNDYYSYNKLLLPIHKLGF